MILILVLIIITFILSRIKSFKFKLEDLIFKNKFLFRILFSISNVKLNQLILVKYLNKKNTSCLFYYKKFI
jgi:hypothetical protein